MSVPAKKMEDGEFCRAKLRNHKSFLSNLLVGLIVEGNAALYEIRDVAITTAESPSELDFAA